MIRLSTRALTNAKPPLSRSTNVSTVLTITDLGTVVSVDTTPVADVFITLPTSPQVNDTYYLLDSKANWGTHAVIVASNTFFGQTQTVTLDATGITAVFTWRGAPTGWTVGADNSNLDSTQLNALISQFALSNNPVLTGTVNMQGATAVNVPVVDISSNDNSAASTAFVNAKAGLVASATMLSANTTLTSAYKGQLTPVDTSAGVVSITLPTTGNVLNDTYGFYDPKGTWSTNNVTFIGGKIHSQASNVIANVSNVSIVFKYINATIGWIKA